VSLYDHDGASGQERRLFALGDFTTAGGLTVNRVARWDGYSWSPVGTGLDNVGFCAQVFDEDGSGPGKPVLFVGGGFATAGGTSAPRIARWDGVQWSAVGGTGTNASVRALVPFDDGTGLSLYAGGVFTTIGTVAANRVARWNGSAWIPLGSGTDGPVRAMAIHDNGTGPRLYIAGDFNLAGGQSASRVAKWNGSEWEPAGSLPLISVLSLVAFDAGTGEKLYATANAVMYRLDGTTWTAVSSPPAGALAVFDRDGDGPEHPALYAGGAFTTFGGGAMRRVARFDGAQWTEVAGGLPGFSNISSLSVIDRDGTGPELPWLIAGGPTSGENLLGGGIVRLEGEAWSQFGAGPWERDNVAAATTFDTDGNGPGGPDLYVGGNFLYVGNTPAASIARWDGANWHALGSGLLGIGNTEHWVDAMATFDDGSGPALYVGGAFQMAGGNPAIHDGVARWDGVSWSAVGGGPGSGVRDLRVFDDGTGAALYASGSWTGPMGNHISKWNGSTWTPLGSGLDGYGKWPMEVFDDDGPGPHLASLYVGGYFENAGGMLNRRLAKWDGLSWSSVGAGFDGNDYVSCMVVHDDGTGAALYVGGSFLHAGGANAKCIAKWNGTSWSAVGPPVVVSVVDHLASYDDGTGHHLYAGGGFQIGGTLTRVARWNGTAWSSLGGGVAGSFYPEIMASCELDAGPLSPDGPALVFTGRFTSAGAVSAGKIATWVGCTGCYANCDGSLMSPVLNVNDFICFLNRFGSGDPVANCDGSTAPPTLNVADFVCFLNKYAAGCP
jgi:hypothetical protein